MLGDAYAHPSVYMGWMGARAVCLMLEVFVCVGVSGECARGCVRSLQCVYMGVSGEYRTALGCFASN